MNRTPTLLRSLAAAAGLSLIAGCTGLSDPKPATAATAADGPILAGAWYQVFFDTDGSEINDRGKMIIRTVANVVKADQQVRITIVGKTDREGTASSNVALSQKRVERVRDALIAQAVPASRIDFSWVGEAKQNVVTADNIAEKRNRVVDIAVLQPY